MQIGRQQILKAKRYTDNGCYLTNAADEEVLLPNAYIPEQFSVGDQIKVFIYKDSEDRIVAVTTKPYVQLEEFAYLKVIDVNSYGAFLDWGLPKDLLVPYSEQAMTMEVGKSYLIFVCYDEETDRLIGSAKVKQFIYFDDIDLALHEEVIVLPYKKTNHGIECIINNMYRGLIFYSDIFKPIKLGIKFNAYVKNIREDGKIDLSIEPIGFKHSAEKNSHLILQYLRANDGYLKLTDKSTPEEINQLFGISKKSFKRVIGHLYKNKLIILKPDGIKLIKDR